AAPTIGRSHEPVTARPALARQSKPNSGAPQSAASAPDALQSLLSQAQEALDRKDFESAIVLIQKILVERPEDALPHFELGYAYSELKRNVQAVTEYRRAIALDPTLSAAHIN